ncbi:MAG TPA: Crp/Fnr family transcriptional regulator [Roseomonas sp.]|nr:Crp/Fnr family transcriptional regulator [Roseomonas sp.]
MPPDDTDAPPAHPDATRIDQLRRLPVLREASDETLRRAAAQAVWRSYGPGGLVLDLDDPSGDVWFVLEGTVRIQVRTPSGREVILSDIAAGGMFGEVAAIDGAPRTAGATALVRSRLCAIPAAAFLDAACSAPAASLALLRSVTAILRRQSKRLVERETLPVRLRIYAELLRLSRPRLGQAAGAEERVVSPPPRRHILAARIGARREAVSREFADLTRRGLIAKERGAIVLRQPQALRQAVEEELEAGAGLA